ncbi:MAG: DNA polymerase III epsilon subunit (EC [uncultured Sulfurovum sp.]|uniref:DNA polymerase III epsilon subunit (EC) n=1 Tax=uncultured Sulfurovum sp. TaxID=269237 RepID=A0A6S6UEC4_9BACT|nr:MAG: DNA polymerase III epsilon subunit (EC [uncultured Sulfurovum sp.]
MINKLKYKYQKAKLKNKDFDFLFNELDDNEEYVSFDCETTGLNPKKDEILSIGAVKLIDNKIEFSESFEKFLSPINHISQESIKIHHIRPCDIANCIDSKIAIEEFLHFIGNRTLIGYYIKFDIAMINRYAKKLIGTTIPNKSIELSTMYYKRYQKQSSHEFVDLKFDTIMEKLDLPKLGQHDALNDAVMSAMMYLKLKHMAEYKGAYS